MQRYRLVRTWRLGKPYAAERMPKLRLLRSWMNFGGVCSQGSSVRPLSVRLSTAPAKPRLKRKWSQRTMGNSNGVPSPARLLVRWRSPLG
jgi:hypothetical protein